MISFIKKARALYASQESVDWDEMGRPRSDPASSFQSLPSTSRLGGFVFPSIQDPEKAGPIRLPIVPAPRKSRSKLRRVLLRTVPKLAAVLALYGCCAWLVTRLLLSQHSETRSLLYSHAEKSHEYYNNTPLWQDLSVTLGVTPKRIASHNDYERTVPLFTALATGATSVEADVWLIDGEVRLAHHRHLATPEKTLKTLYVDPLVEILRQASDVPSDTVKGVFQMAPAISLQLLIDFKEDSTELYNAVMQELEPLRSAGYLTTYNDTINRSAVTAVGTGLARLDLITAQTPRDLFFDARLDLLSTQHFHLDPSISPIASVDLARTGYRSSSFWRKFPRLQLWEWVRVAHSRGIAVRVWNVPTNSWLRRRVWRDLIKLGVDWLHCDELEEASVM